MKFKVLCVTLLLFGFATVRADSLPGAFLSGSGTSQDDTRVNIPAGTRILVRTTDSIDSGKQRAGQRFTGSLETDLRADSVLVAPRGTTVHGRLIGAQSAGRIAGEGLLTLELTDIVIGGTAHPLVTASYEVRSNGQGGQSAGRIGGGAGLGALVGGIAGGARGAGMGAAVGAAGGTAASAATTGQQVSIPSESLLEFRLDRPAQLPATR
jgi:hypothetical protein